jgi:hypothetical protein
MRSRVRSRRVERGGEARKRRQGAERGWGRGWGVRVTAYGVRSGVAERRCGVCTQPTRPAIPRRPHPHRATGHSIPSPSLPPSSASRREGRTVRGTVTGPEGKRGQTATAREGRIGRITGLESGRVRRLRACCPLALPLSVWRLATLPASQPPLNLMCR